jgi:hypothetical protein
MDATQPHHLVVLRPARETVVSVLHCNAECIRLATKDILIKNVREQNAQDIWTYEKKSQESGDHCIMNLRIWTSVTSDQVMEDEMGGACRKNETDEKCIRRSEATAREA